MGLERESLSTIYGPLPNATSIRLLNLNWLHHVFCKAKIECKICQEKTSIKAYHCSICSDGDFDICYSCKEGGAHCLNENHTLIEKYSQDKERFSPARLSICMHTFELADVPKFAALSYTWDAAYRHPYTKAIDTDEDSVSYPILCNGVLLEVRKNLFDALKTFNNVFNNEKVEWLWVDALCINQSDDEERSLQVAFMDKIYSAAAKVMIWLGNSSRVGFPELQWAIDEFLPTLTTYMEEHNVEKVWIHDPEVSRELGIEREDLYQKLIKMTIWSLSCRWFSRVWIVQEYYLAQETVWVSGNRQIKGEDLFHLVRVFENSGVTSIIVSVLLGFLNLPKEERSTITVHPFLNLQRWLLLQPSREPPAIDWFVADEDGQKPIAFLLSALLVGRKLECHQPHDHVYAFLGLATARYPNGPWIKDIVPDYSISIQELYLQVATLFFSRARCLDFLQWSRDGSKASRIAELPSWVPDWTTERTTNGGVLCDATDGIPLGEYTHSVSESTLNCHGACFAVIESVLTNGLFDGPTIRWREALRFANGVANPVDGEDRIAKTWNIFWRTLIWDEGDDFNYPAPAEYGHAALWLARVDILREFNERMKEGSRQQDTDTEVGELKLQDLTITESNLDAFLCSRAETQRLYARELEARDGNLDAQREMEEMHHISSPYTVVVNRATCRNLFGARWRMALDGEKDSADSTGKVVEEKEKRKEEQGEEKEVESLLGIGPDDCRAGDQVWFLCNSNMAFVLRPVVKEKEESKERDEDEKRGKEYEIVGPCYVHGFMDGGMVDGEWGVRGKIEPIRIV